MNQKGNTTLLGILFITLTALSSYSLISRKLSNLNDQKENQKLHMCAKYLNGETKEFIIKIKRTNKVILTLSLLQAGSIAFPMGKVINQSTLKKMKNTAQLSQRAFLLSYMNHFKLLTQKKCLFTPNALLTPYKINISFNFKRDYLGRAIRRKKRWSYKNISSLGYIKNKINLESTTLAFQSKKVMFQIPVKVFLR